jgi:2-polyprenyl-3-methyl-5-hydroxy-6-metoxy-1,4-benzoquinol methylase
MIDCQEKYPEFYKILQLIVAKNPMQRKKIETFIQEQDDNYWLLAEKISRVINHSFLVTNQDKDEVVHAYQKMCKDLLREQIRFRKTGIFHVGTVQQAYETVYSQEKVMRYYLIGLLLSYLFWPNHYKMFRFFQKNTANIRSKKQLEIGAGHGLFTAEIRQMFPEVHTTVIDISNTAIALSSKMLGGFGINSSEINFVQHDFLTVDLITEKFDFIVMGEVLEHVSEPLAFLNRAEQLLSNHGTIYLSTCANAPAIDHIYHFKTVNEIRELIAESGFVIKQEIVLPAEDIPQDRWLSELVPINYAAICMKKD